MFYMCFFDVTKLHKNFDVAIIIFRKMNKKSIIVSKINIHTFIYMYAI
jgi:hypothetical protein